MFFFFVLKMASCHLSRYQDFWNEEINIACFIEDFLNTFPK